MADRSDALARRRFLAGCSTLGLSATLMPGVLWARLQQAREQRLTAAMVREAAAVAGLSLTDEDTEAIVAPLNRVLATADALHAAPPENDAPSPVLFNPRVPGFEDVTPDRPFRPTDTEVPGVPPDLETAAFWPITDLAHLIRTRRVTARQLTEMYLSRLERHNGALNCVVTLMADRARAAADERDRELAAGRYRGLLHGIPWGVKDIVAARGAPTTWGTAAFERRMIDADATVVERLDAAGAVLVAKLTTGELAFGDRWFGGRTNNPWNPEQGSSGSSAGSGSATAGGLVGFSIGSDTGGSIIAPSLRCGVTGLRPTFGRVSRHGVMAAGWTLDKLGPMCRTVEDCAIVLQAISGPDGRDLAIADEPLPGWTPGESVAGWRVGIVPAFIDGIPDDDERANARRAIQALVDAGIELRTIDVPQSNLTYFIEYTERAAGFETFVQQGAHRQMTLRGVAANLQAYHLVTAVDYLQANRERLRLMVEYARVTDGLQAVIGGRSTLETSTSLNPLTSMTGHPMVALPTGFRADGTPTGLTIAGRLYDEAGLLRLARIIEAATGLGGRRPPLG